MDYYLYVIRSDSSGKIYIGQTSNLKIRLRRHNQELPSKEKSYTAKNKGPWRLVYKERFSTRKEVIKREKQLKTSRGRAYLKKKINYKSQ